MSRNPRIPRIARFVLAVGALIALAAFASCTRKGQDGQQARQPEAQAPAAKKPLYRCTMHPAVTSDKPGICPICHMDLELVEDESAASATAPATAPGQSTSGATSPPAAEGSAGGASQLAGRAAFTLSAEKQQMIGVTTAKIASIPLSFDVRASGRVAFDPDLFTAVEEYRQAAISRAQMVDARLKEQSDELVASARTKLKLMGLSDDQIRALTSKKTSPMSLLLPKGAVWIYAEVFEYEVSGLKPGQKMEVETPSLPGKIYAGKITSINPVVEAPTRTVRVRGTVPDPDGLLRPDTFVNVKIRVEMGTKIAVPENAVLFSGDRKFVFVVKEQGRFEPRAIQTGTKAQNHYEVLSGLAEGETIVTSANFLIDSESRLRAVLESAAPQAEPAAGQPSGARADPAPSPAPGGHQHK